MARIRYAIAVARRQATLVGLKGPAHHPHVVFERHIERGRGISVTEALRRLISAAPPAYKGTEVRLALSPLDLACSDLCPVPFGSASQLEAIAETLTESRCAGELAEDLAIDLAPLGNVNADGNSIAELIAIPHESMDAIRKAIAELLPEARLKVVSSIPCALTRLLPALNSKSVKALTWLAAGEVILCGYAKAGHTQFRAFPYEGSIDLAKQKALETADTWGLTAEQVLFIDARTETQVEFSKRLHFSSRTMAAVATGMFDPLRDANLLRGCRDAPRRLIAKLAPRLRTAMLAATLFFVSVGLWLNREGHLYETGLDPLRAFEKQAWKKVLPDQPWSPDHLLSEIQRRVTQHRKESEIEQPPSALACWNELAEHLPDPNSVDLTVESLTISSDEGQLVGHVKQQQQDHMQNANNIQRALNRSARLTTRGSFQTRGEDVTVNIRFQFTPTPKKTVEVAEK